MRTAVKFTAIAQSWGSSPNRFSDRVEIGYLPRSLTYIGGRWNSVQHFAASGPDGRPALPLGRFDVLMSVVGFHYMHAGISLSINDFSLYPRAKILTKISERLFDNVHSTNGRQAQTCASLSRIVLSDSDIAAYP